MGLEPRGACIGELGRVCGWLNDVGDGRVGGAVVVGFGGRKKESRKR